MGHQGSRDLDPKLEGTLGIIQPHLFVLQMGTQVQDGQESDPRSRRDSLILLLLHHCHERGLPSPAHLTS